MPDCRLYTFGTLAPQGDWSWHSEVPADRADLLLGRVVWSEVPWRCADAVQNLVCQYGDLVSDALWHS